MFLHTIVMDKLSELYLASQNTHKAEELEQLLAPAGIKIHTLLSAGITGDLEETGDTFEANALQKALQAFELLGKPVLADDSGLEVRALNWQPGVYSARYAGEHGNAQKNTEKLLKNLGNHPDRFARFRTVLCLYAGQEPLYFEGIVEGEITTVPAGKGGFGYDPVFRALGHNLTFAEITPKEKNQVSHRARAVQKLLDYLLH